VAVAAILVVAAAASASPPSASAAPGSPASGSPASGSPGSGSLSSGSTPPAASAAIPISKAIQHVVVVIQENHSFDNVLGKLCREVASGQILRPGAGAACDGATSGLTVTGQKLKLAPAADRVPGVLHDEVTQQDSIDGGKMDGFSLNPDCQGAAVTNCYSQYDPLAGPCASSNGSCIPNVAALAEHYTVSDRTFEFATTPSFGGHLVFASGTLDGLSGDNPMSGVAGAPTPVSKGPGWGCDSGLSAYLAGGTLVPACVPDAGGSLGPNWAGYSGPTVAHVPTIFDELDAKGLSWRLYAGTGSAGKGGPGFDLDGWQWAICPYFAECLYGPQRSDVVPSTQILSDAAAGALPAFSLVTPTAADSQHNDYFMSAGDDWIGQLLSAIEAGPQWSSTAVIVTWDDCGCMYDHVNPLAFNPGWGIRVPLMIVSPWAKEGYTDHHPTTFAGILALAEHVFGLSPLTSADGSAYDYAGAFCLGPSGCTPAGTAPVPMVTQPVPTMTPAEQRAAVAAAKEDT
jgi:phospholipase C